MIEVQYGTSVFRFAESYGRGGEVSVSSEWTDLVDRVFAGAEGSVQVSSDGACVASFGIAGSGCGGNRFLSGGSDRRRIEGGSQGFVGACDGEGEAGRVSGGSEVTLGDGVLLGPSVGVSVGGEKELGAVGSVKQVKRPGKKQRDRLRRKKDRQEHVPEWRRKGVDGSGVKSDARKTLEEKWVLQNKVDALKLEEQLKRLELSAGDQRSPVLKVRTEVDAHLEAEAHRKKLRNDIQKYEADAAYWSKRKQSGAVDKAIALEMEILDGQLSGKYDVFADRRTIGWAKTVRTNSSTGSSAKKTVWSGSGASKLSDSSESLVSLEKYEASEKERRELLKKNQAQEVEIKRVTDVAKQLQRKLRFDREEERKNSLYSAYE